MSKEIKLGENMFIRANTVIFLLFNQKKLAGYTRKQIVTACAFWIVILFGAGLRFWGLGDRPLHFDESLHAYFSMVLLHNNIDHWSACVAASSDIGNSCYHYDPLTHGPFQFHIIAFIYRICQWLGVPDQGINTTTVRIAAVLSGITLIGLPYYIRDYIGTIGAWAACFLLAISPSMVYFSRFAREGTYMIFFTMLMIVAIARYIRDRRAKWLLVAALAFTFSYTTSEATFLTMAVFGSFLGALIIWEFGMCWSFPLEKQVPVAIKRFTPHTLATLLLIIYFVGLGIGAKLFFGQLQFLAAYITRTPENTKIADTYVAQLKLTTESLLPWFGIILAVYVSVLIILEMMGKAPRGIQNLKKFVDAKKQPILDALVTMPWTHWFFALVCSFFVFILLFTVLFTYAPKGIGDGVWQGLYYWLQQQQVARGGQPWYYYFLLIPLYEQIGVVFGLIGMIRCLTHPTRFHLFLVYWFVGNVFIYSWAAEKMPWLMIQMTLPMLLLAGIALEPIIITLFLAIKRKIINISEPKFDTKEENKAVLQRQKNKVIFAQINSILITVITILLLVVTLQNMIQVNYIHQADSNHEMMVYVQTTPEINTIMSKLQASDQKLYQGKHQLFIGVTDDASWPFSWYLRDYTHVCFRFPTGCPDQANNVQAIVSGASDTPKVQINYGNKFVFHEYHLFDQWDQGYMPPPCQSSPQNQCKPQQYTGVGPLLWLSYGDTVPTHAQFNPLNAVNRIWRWWWQRIPIGSPDGGGFTSVTLSIQTNLQQAP